MAYDYHVLHVDDEWLTSNKSGDATYALDNLGKDGWRVVGTLTLEDKTHVIILQKDA
jgi:hypothetical protein